MVVQTSNKKWIAPFPRWKLNQTKTCIGEHKRYTKVTSTTSYMHVDYIHRLEISDKTRDSKKKDTCQRQSDVYFYEWTRSFSHESCGKPPCFSSDWRCCISFPKMVSYMFNSNDSSMSWGTIFYLWAGYLDHSMQEHMHRD